MKIFLIAFAAIILSSVKSFSQASDTIQKVDYNKVFTKVETPAKFPGGKYGWNAYVKRNLDENLSKYIQTKQTAIVQFIIDKEGQPSDIKVVNKGAIHEKLVDAALRIIKNGPKWEPAFEKGRRVVSQTSVEISYPFTEVSLP